ncbi:hypothetical protein OJAV_G00054920 [Oryzias javanicus]|uniref:ferroxidase n=1 Tax=Oryzias javanicus TaxID=123683 RepID=A0A3S2MQ91_ORYJA|nr:hypothetical protein OJAV_G00054920 [Oryzias javanicus]
MNSVLLSVRPLMQMFEGKAKDFINEIDNVHMVWLEEIQQEANRIFSRDFNAAPELMPKTPSQKKNSRRKRVSLGRQEENQTRRRFSKGRRSNLRGSPVKSLNLIAEEPISEESSSKASSTAQPKRTTRKKKQTKLNLAEDENTSVDNNEAEAAQNKKPDLLNEEDVDKKEETEAEEVPHEQVCDVTPSPPKIPAPEVVVRISSEERLSAEMIQQLQDSPGRKAVKVPIAKPPRKTRRSSVRCSLKVRHSLAGLRHSMTKASVRRSSQRSMLKRKATRTNNSTLSSNIDEDSPMDTADENDDVHSETEAEAPSAEPEIIKDNSQINTKTEQRNSPLERITRSMAANSEKLASSSLPTTKPEVSSPDVGEEQQETQIVRRSSRSTKRKAPDATEDSPTKRLSPPKKTQSAVKPSMRSFLHTVQKNQMLMMTPNSLGRTGVIKSFIKHTTPLKIDSKMSIGFVTKERYKLEALKKKQEQEEERMRKMEEEKRKKQEELKRKREERIRRVFEAKVKEEQREEEKKKKIEQKMAQIDEKNDKRLADEKAKKKVALKRQEEVELKKKLEEEAKKKKLQQQEEEKRQQDLMAKKKAEEEERVRRALELKREQERERELERERQAAAAAAERARIEKEKALALQRELERAAREKEMRELEEKRKALEEKRKLEEQQRAAAKEKALREREEAKLKEIAAEKKTVAGLNLTVDLEKSVLNTPDKKGLNVTVDIVHSSPQSYVITPKGANKPLLNSKNLDDYGMDQNSDDSTDDESAPRKPIPSWAEGPNLKQIIMKQYFNPPDLDTFFGIVEPPKLENIFYKSKPRYFKRTSSAVWHSPPAGAKIRIILCVLVVKSLDKRCWLLSFGYLASLTVRSCKVSYCVTCECANIETGVIFSKMNSQIRQNFHQDCEAAINRQINLELYASYVYLSMAYYFERDDKQLPHFAKFFNSQSKDEREHAEKLMSLQNKRGGRIFLQDIKKPDRDEWGSSLEALECALQLEKSVNQSLLDLQKLATDHGDPHLCDFIETHFLDEQVKSIKQLGDWISNLRRMGAPQSGMAEYLFDKHTMAKEAN